MLKPNNQVDDVKFSSGFSNAGFCFFPCQEGKKWKFFSHFNQYIVGFHRKNGKLGISLDVCKKRLLTRSKSHNKFHMVEWVENENLIKRTKGDRLLSLCVVGRAFASNMSQYRNKQPAKYALQNNYIEKIREILRKMSMVRPILNVLKNLL